MFSSVKKLLALGVVAAVCLVGCAGYNVRRAPDFGEHPAVTRSVDGVAVRVTSFDTDESVESVFDASLRRNGVLPVFLRVENGSPDPVRLRRREMALSANQTGFAQLAPNAIAKRVAYSPLTRYFAWSFGLFGIGIVPGLVDGANATEANRAMRDDFHSKLLKNRILSPGERAAGFVYFDVPSRVRPTDFAMEIEVRPDGSETAARLSFAFDLRDRSGE